MLASLRERILHPHEWVIDICSGTPETCRDHRRVYGTNTNQYARIMQAFFTPVASSGQVTAVVYDTANASKTLNIRFGGTANSSSITAFGAAAASTGGNALDVYVQLGTGTTAAARSDYNLQTAIAGTFSVAVSWSDGSAALSITATATYGSNKQPTELGLFMQGTPTLSAAIDTFLLDHTVFGALAANTTFTITYTLTLG